MVRKMTICPVCNGLTTLHTSCPICHEMTEDLGKVSDFFSEYSPYQSIDLCKRSNGWMDQKHRTCIHQMVCRHCGYQELEMVHEQEGG